jgi:hypothetical protein
MTAMWNLYLLFHLMVITYEGVSKSFWTGHMEWELQMVQLSATRCSCITILWASLVSFATITPCVASQWVCIVVVYFVIDSVWKLLDTPSYTELHLGIWSCLWLINHDLMYILCIEYFFYFWKLCEVVWQSSGSGIYTNGNNIQK